MGGNGAKLVGKCGEMVGGGGNVQTRGKMGGNEEIMGGVVEKNVAEQEENGGKMPPIFQLSLFVTFPFPIFWEGLTGIGASPYSCIEHVVSKYPPWKNGAETKYP